MASLGAGLVLPGAGLLTGGAPGVYTESRSAIGRSSRSTILDTRKLPRYPSDEGRRVPR
jgi:hypothetical protein